MLCEIHHVSLHDGNIEPYKFETLPKQMFDEIFKIFPKSTLEGGVELTFEDKTYQIETESYKSEGGITKIYFKMLYPSWAKAHLVTIGYGKQNLDIFKNLRDGKLGEKCEIEKVPIPYLVTRIEPGIIMDKQSLAWIEPCARCIGWMGLDVKNYLHFMYGAMKKLK